MKKIIIALFLSFSNAYSVINNVITIGPTLVKNVERKSSPYDLGISMDHWLLFLFKQNISYHCIDKVEIIFSSITLTVYIYGIFTVGVGRNFSRRENFIDIGLYFNYEPTLVSFKMPFSFHYKIYLCDIKVHKITFSYSFDIYKDLFTTI